MRPPRRALLAAAVLAVPLLTGCAPSPADELADRSDAVVRSAGAHDPDALRDRVAELTSAVRRQRDDGDLGGPEAARLLALAASITERAGMAALPVSPSATPDGPAASPSEQPTAEPSAPEQESSEPTPEPSPSEVTPEPAPSGASPQQSAEASPPAPSDATGGEKGEVKGKGKGKGREGGGG